jgi:putative membrane protein
VSAPGSAAAVGDAPALRGALLVMLAALLLSGWAPLERSTWLMEVAPVLIAAPLLWCTRRRLPLTTLAYVLIALHALILTTGGHYTYAQVPLGHWVQQAFGLARNDFDRLGHFAQGFVPAILTRELLLRCTPLRRGGWLFTLTVATCLAISACYEFIEWWSALLLGAGADAFLATQGDPWDTQWDMFTALIGALCALLLLARYHDAQLARLAPRAAADGASGAAGAVR